jgi:uncharacterized protein YgbK (DUF1537 family)
MAVLMGCIADDFTGGTDLASMLVKSGMRTVQTVGLPETNLRCEEGYSSCSCSCSCSCSMCWACAAKRGSAP